MGVFCMPEVVKKTCGICDDVNEAECLKTQMARCLPVPSILHTSDDVFSDGAGGDTLSIVASSMASVCQWAVVIGQTEEGKNQVMTCTVSKTECRRSHNDLDSISAT